MDKNIPGPSSEDPNLSNKCIQVKGSCHKGDPGQRSTTGIIKPCLTLELFEQEMCNLQTFLTDSNIIPSKIKPNDSSIMFPPIPTNPFPDAYPEDGYPGARPDAEQQQMDLETEVSVYRALEKLNRGLVVFQSFKYTPEQNSLFGGEAVGGEADFVVLGGDCCVILEVKRIKDLHWFNTNISKKTKKTAKFRRKGALLAALENGRKQRRRTQKLICNLIHCFKEDGNMANIGVYTIIGGLIRDDALRMLGTLNEDKLQKVLFLEDFIEDANRCWQGLLYYKAGTKPHKSMLLAISTLWCLSAKNEFEIKSFDLSYTIKKIDTELKRSRVTKDTRKNPAIGGSPSIFKEYMGIENLSLEQKEIFKSTEKVCEINGSAGTGKTILGILLLGKLIQITKKNDFQKSLLIVFSEDNMGRCEDILQNANFKTSTYRVNQIFSSDVSYNNFIDVLTGKVNPEAQVIIILWVMSVPIEEDQLIRDAGIRTINLDIILKRLEMEHEMVNVFIDDAQVSSLISGKGSTLFSVSRELVKKAGYVFWYVIDEYQCNPHEFDLGLSGLASFEPNITYSPNLTRNLRNSTSIANVTLALREEVYRSTPNLRKSMLEMLEKIGPNLSMDYLRLSIKRLLNNVHSEFQQNVNMEEAEKIIDEFMMDLVADDREQYMEWVQDLQDITSLSLPRQYVGHKVHGAKVQLHMVLDENRAILKGLLDDELNKLKMLKKDLRIIFKIEDLKQFYEKERENSTYVSNVFSCEWAAVVCIIDIQHYLQDFSKESKIITIETIAYNFLCQLLYVVISRARVYCTVILTGFTTCFNIDSKDKVLRLLDKLDDYVSLTWHGECNWKNDVFCCKNIIILESGSFGFNLRRNPSGQLIFSPGPVR